MRGMAKQCRWVQRLVCGWLIGVPLPMFGADAASPVIATAKKHAAWPVITGALAVAMVFLLAWMQARHRKRVEQSNDELRRSEMEARRAFEALRESQQLLASVTDNISEAVYRSSPEQGLIFVNQAYLRKCSCWARPKRANWISARRRWTWAPSAGASPMKFAPRPTKRAPSTCGWDCCPAK